jgi:hypothetical protein
MKKTYKEFVGKKFGKLTIENIFRKNNIAYAKYKCECGKSKIVQFLCLKNRNNISCGCQNNASFKKQIIKEYVGKRFGIVVIKNIFFENKKSKCEIECDCGTKKVTDFKRIKSGQTKSCGCLKLRTGKIGNKGTDITQKYPLKNIFGLNINGALLRYKANAKYKNRQWLLTDTEATEIMHSCCFYCGTIPKPFVGIDRIDNNKDYLIDNCVACCKTCNLAKRDMSVDEFRKWIDKVFHHINNVV